MTWTEQTIQDLRTLWTQGHSTAEIGRRLGVSKNAIVGKAHRLDLDARPSPIRRHPGSYVPAPPSIPRAAQATLPPLPSYVPPPPVPVASRPLVAPPPPRVLAPVQPIRRVAALLCCWPIGHPGTKTFRFCEATSAPGRPYCAPHCNKAYIRVVREDRAA